MKEKFTDFYEAWDYVSSHPANSIDRKKRHYSENHFLKGCLDMMVVRVNPKTNIRENPDREHLNTKTQFWLEYGEIYTDRMDGLIKCGHDLHLDCGGDTFEEAIINLANNMRNQKRYRDMEIAASKKGKNGRK